MSSSRLESVYPRALREARVKDLYGVNYWTLLNLGLAYDPKRTFGCTSHAKLDGFNRISIF